MPTVIESQIKDRISAFVQELDVLVRKSALEALHGVLNTSGMPARRGRPAGAGVRRGPGRPRAGSADVDQAAEKIVAHVRANDGQGIGAISVATGVALPVAKKATLRLLAEGALKKSGQKRGTVYHVGSGRPARAKRAKKRGRKARAA